MTKRAVLWALGWYRQYRGLRPDACRFDPTCSAYAAQAVERHGVAKGAWLALRRVSRCHPLGGSGYDPVPDSAPRFDAETGSTFAPNERAADHRPDPLLTPLLKRRHHA